MKYVAAINSERRFEILIKTDTPYLANLFDFDKTLYKAEEVDNFLSTASLGQKIMAQFALGVWSGTDKFSFDFTEAAAHLDQEQIRLL